MTRAALFCAGRGSYTERSLGSLKGSLAYVQRAEELRVKYGLPSLLELDRAQRFSAARHLDPVNSSALIWLVSMLDAERARQEAEIVCVGGNSLGWYTALTVAGALSFEDGFRLMQGMAMLQAELAREQPELGGQLVYPLVDEAWRPLAEREACVAAALASSNGEALVSIRLGGLIVLAGNQTGMQHLMSELEPVELGKNRYPLKLTNHGPYHTPWVREVSVRARETLAQVQFRRPHSTLIDGHGKRYTPWGTDPTELAEYTLGAQVQECFDFTTSVRVALREFAPETIVLPGPGSSLAGVVGQILVAERWRGLATRDAFRSAQDAEHAPLQVMGAR